MRYYSSTAGKMTLVTGVSNTQTTLQVDTTTGLPSSYPYSILIEPGTVREEICTVTTAAGTTLTVTRGQDGSSGQTHAAGVEIRHGFSARDLQEPQNHINATTNVHGLGVGSAVVGTTDNQTLANKVISGASNTITNLAKSALPTDVTYVNDAATLTQKTISGTANTISNIQKSALPGDTVFTASLQTLTGKTIDGGSNTLTNIAKTSLPNDIAYTGSTITWTGAQTFSGGLTAASPTFTGTVTGADAAYSGNIKSAATTGSNSRTRSPGAMVRMTSTISVPSTGSSYTTITWAGHWSASNQDFTVWTAADPTNLTAPVSGRYCIAGSMVFTGNGTGGRAAALCLNGTGFFWASAGGDASFAWQSLPFAVNDVYLSAGDKIQLRVLQTSGAAMAVGPVNGAIPTLSMSYIGNV